MDATIAEFPFVATLPKREKSKLRRLWDQLEVYKAAVDTYGALVPGGFAAGLIGVSKQRVHQLIEDGRLQVVVVQGHNFITEDSLVAFAKSERKNGVRIGVESASDCVRFGMAVAREAYQEAKKRS